MILGQWAETSLNSEYDVHPDTVKCRFPGQDLTKNVMSCQSVLKEREAADLQSNQSEGVNVTC